MNLSAFPTGSEGYSVFCGNCKAITPAIEHTTQRSSYALARIVAHRPAYDKIRPPEVMGERILYRKKSKMKPLNGKDKRSYDHVNCQRLLLYHSDASITSYENTNCEKITVWTMESPDHD